MRFLKPVLVVAVVLAIAAGGGSFAESKVAVMRSAQQGAEKCGMKEESTLNANFNKSVSDIAQAKPLVDGKIKEIEGLAKQAGITDIDITSLNYSINSNGSSDCQSGPSAFQVYGNMSFKVLPADKATDFLAVLSGKGFNVSFNSNAYKQCGDAYEMHGE